LLFEVKPAAFHPPPKVDSAVLRFQPHDRAADLGIADRAAYNASKHGLIGLTRTLAAEWGGRGVRCNAVCPGWVKTEMDAADQANGTYSDEDIMGVNPMGRFAYPDDIASAILFLADAAQRARVELTALLQQLGFTQVEFQVK